MLFCCNWSDWCDIVWLGCVFVFIVLLLCFMDCFCVIFFDVCFCWLCWWLWWGWVIVVCGNFWEIGVCCCGVVRMCGWIGVGWLVCSWGRVWVVLVVVLVCLGVCCVWFICVWLFGSCCWIVVWVVFCDWGSGGRLLLVWCWLCWWCGVCLLFWCCCVWIVLV